MEYIHICCVYWLSLRISPSVTPCVADHGGIRFRSNFAALRRNFVLAEKKYTMDTLFLALALFLDLLNRILVAVSWCRQLFSWGFLRDPSFVTSMNKRFEKKRWKFVDGRFAFKTLQKKLHVHIHTAFRHVLFEESVTERKFIFRTNYASFRKQEVKPIKFNLSELD